MMVARKVENIGVGSQLDLGDDRGKKTNGKDHIQV
jgi:hypothetical protein